MINVNNWNEIQKRYEQTWQRKNTDRACIYLSAWKKNENYIQPPKAKNLQDAWENPEIAVINALNGFNGTQYFAEGFPLFNPNLGPDIFGAILGGKIEYSNVGTSWATHIAENCGELGRLEFSEENEYYKKIYAITEEGLKAAKNGDFIVGQTDIHTSLDAITSLIGPQNVCFDIKDDKEALKNRLNEQHEAFEKYFTKIENLISKSGQTGTANWCGIYSEKRFYITSSDFICLISDEDFKEFTEPILRKELDFLGRSIFHLDGADALRHLDALLKIPTLDGIQWVPGEGKPSASKWLDVLSKIQDAKKCLQIFCHASEIPEIAKNLRSEGLFLNCSGCEGEAHADKIINLLLKK